MHSILLLPLVARCLQTIDVCYGAGCFYVCCSDCVGVCGKVCCVAAVVKNSVFLAWSVKYVVCLCRDVMDVVFSVCIVRHGAVGARVWGV